MTKILVVDDEPAQSRGLSRAILLRRPDYTVLTSQSGADAISVMEEQDIDLVITDLQMTDMNGFELLAWLLGNRPGVLAFAMTAYLDDDAKQRLTELGSIECFSKPLDVDALLARLAEGLSQSIRGHVHNVGLASFLQLIELEQKTCTLTVRHGDQVGELFMRKGELFDARTGLLTGEVAAYAIISWINVSLSIVSGCPVSERAIHRPTYHVVMEAMRLCDEKGRPSGRRSTRPPFGIVQDTFPPRPTEQALALLNERESRRPPRSSLEPFHVPNGALAMAIIEISSGAVLAGQDYANLDLSELSRSAHSLLQKENSTVTLAAGSGESVEELVLIAGARGELMRPLPGGEQFVLLVFDSTQTNLVMARHELARFVGEYVAAAVGA